MIWEHARSAITTNDSPDLPFELSINPYRGCEHGCIYCYARPSHAYLELSPGLDFETRLFAKVNAVERLREELARPGYRPTPIALGANTDCYQPIERRYRITRGLIELLAECRHPLTIVTKSALVERDLDLLGPMGRANAGQGVRLARHARPPARAAPGAARGAPQRRLDTRAGRRRRAGRRHARAGGARAVGQVEEILAAAAARRREHGRLSLMRLPNELKRCSANGCGALPLARRARDEHRAAAARRARQRPALPHPHDRHGNYAELLAKRFRRPSAGWA